MNEFIIFFRAFSHCSIPSHGIEPRYAGILSSPFCPVIKRKMPSVCVRLCESVANSLHPRLSGLSQG
jgi:hypothetical protein